MWWGRMQCDWNKSHRAVLMSDRPATLSRDFDTAAAEVAAPWRELWRVAVAPPITFDPSCAWLLADLVARPELNGQLVRVQGYDERRERYHAHVAATGEDVWVRGQNIIERDSS